MSQQSLPKALWQKTVTNIIEKLGLQEVTAADGGPYITYTSHLPMAQGEVGNFRLYKGDSIYQLCTCSIVVPAIQLDSHMMFAFTHNHSAVPHFTLDSVEAGGHCAFHLDLIPRLDLGANLAYMNEVFDPLTETHKAAKALEGLSPAEIGPRQFAVMSPWMYVSRATPDAFAKIDGTVEAYANHWLSVLAKGVSEEALGGVTADQLAVRNQRNKDIIFDPDVDRVWAQITPLIGAEHSEATRLMLKKCD